MFANMAGLTQPEASGEQVTSNSVRQLLIHLLSQSTNQILTLSLIYI